MSRPRPLRFHWSLSQAGQLYRRAQSTATMSGLPMFEAQLELCRAAEVSGIDSMLMAIGFARPDPMVLASALAMHTDSIKFMVACRAGLISPTLFVQQINTLAGLTNGRVHVNMVSGHTPKELNYYGDFLDHDARYDRLAEFLEVCRGLWDQAGPVSFQGQYYQIEGARVPTRFGSSSNDRPEIFVGGSSDRAASIASEFADCLWRLASPASSFGEDAARSIDRGAKVGVLVSLIARSTREEAMEAAEALIAPFGEPTRAIHRDFAHASDSVGFRSTYALADREEGSWLGDCLWSGAVPYLGAPAIALVGSFDEVARSLVDYKHAGASEFLLMGWPDLDELIGFGREVLPRVRDLEALNG